ncbi:MAG TPA: Y-family DNA polymerase, partial [Parafilimonas sp.]|nr:Y-family DNA polymerase [Parafilimonas sp.]
FRPELRERPVVVLSNNDGCIVSRTDEAKRLGIEMAGPYFKARPLIEENDVTVFSSNYNLYGDMSWRVMETLRLLVGEANVEVYSVDEAFLNLTDFSAEHLQEIALKIRHTVERWTGVAVSVGVAQTKVLCKVANHIAKKSKNATQCVTVLDSKHKINEALASTEIKEIWGVGRQYADKLTSFGIYDALTLSKMPEEWAKKNLGGVVGVRLIKELKGEPAIVMDEPLIEKKMIATTRMFGTPVTELKDIKEAVATYTSRAAEKLRRQFGAASVVSVFVVPKEERPRGERFKHGRMISEAVVLSNATSVTSELIKPAVYLAEKVFRIANKERPSLFKKAGVTLSGIVKDELLQGNLFRPSLKNNGRLLMSMMDNINFSMRDDILKFAASGTARNWKMRQEWRSPRYTSRWDELRVVE